MPHAIIPLFLASFSLFASAHAAPAWQDKVDPFVLQHASESRSIEFLIVLQDQVDLASVKLPQEKALRGAMIHDTLRAHAAATQGSLLRALEEAGAPQHSFWIANLVWTRGDLRLIQELAQRADVRRIHANPRVALKPPVREANRAGAGIELNIQQTGAPATFWDAGVTGAGIVVANQDTGVQWNHPALRDRYRGFDGVNAVHDYHWHDAIHSGGGVCGPDTQAPCDDNDHGTSTMGVLVGDDGAGNQIGMAPGAEWIACRNMDQGVGTPATYTECFEWFVAPTDLGGNNPDPSAAPHVISNSWVCTPEEGCTDPEALRLVVENVRAAGILVVASAGNDGSGCSSLSNAPALYADSFSVGSNNLFGEISQFSSRGPVTIDGSYRVKPDIVAPGDDIRTAIRNGGYSSFSGTSLSSPHAAGMAALAMAAQPCFLGVPDRVEQWMSANARPFTTSEVCGAVAGTQVPNNTYGHGILRAAFPAAADCVLPFAGEVTGVGSGSVRCANPATAQTVVGGLSGNHFDCSRAGLSAASGEALRVIIRSTAFAGTIGGEAVGMSLQSVICRNITTGQTIAATLDSDSQGWNCSASGLGVSQGDALAQLLLGTAN